jgi:hypothetical protein
VLISYLFPRRPGRKGPRNDDDDDACASALRRRRHAPTRAALRSTHACRRERPFPSEGGRPTDRRPATVGRRRRSWRWLRRGDFPALSQHSTTTAAVPRAKETDTPRPCSSEWRPDAWASRKCLRRKKLNLKPASNAFEALIFTASTTTTTSPWRPRRRRRRPRPNRRRRAQPTRNASARFALAGKKKIIRQPSTFMVQSRQ